MALVLDEPAGLTGAHNMQRSGQGFFATTRNRRMNLPALTLTVLTVTLLSACASVDSFRKMTPLQRAHEVCTSVNGYTQLDREEREHANKAAEIRQVLDRGYRLHESCRTVEASKAPELACPSRSVRHGDTRCSKEQGGKYKRICRDIPVSIDGALEKEKLANHEMQLQVRAIDKQRFYQRCHAEVVTLSAEQAFDYYQRH